MSSFCLLIIIILTCSKLHKQSTEPPWRLRECEQPLWCCQPNTWLCSSTSFEPSRPHKGSAVQLHTSANTQVALIPLYSPSSLHMWRKDSFILRQMPGWIRKGQQLSEGTQPERKSIVVCRLGRQPWESKYPHYNKNLQFIKKPQCSCFPRGFKHFCFLFLWPQFIFYPSA